MFKRLGPVGIGLLVASLLVDLPAALADGAGSLSGAGASLVCTARTGEETVVATFRDWLAGHSARQVDRVFRDLLNRPVDPAALAYYLPLIESASGSRALAAGVLDSDEYAHVLIRGWYDQFLGRAPTDPEAASLVDALRSGARDEALLATLLGSMEYFSGPGRGTNSGFLEAVYQDLLGRPIDDAARAQFNSLLIFSGTRAQVVSIITGSREYRGRLVSGYFSQFLDRDPAADELTWWIDSIQRGARFEDVIESIVGSDEYSERVAAPSYSATIAWGDGQSSTAATVAGAQGGFDVRASHTYAEWGDFAVQITISDGLGSKLVLISGATVLPAVQSDNHEGAVGGAGDIRPGATDGAIGQANANTQSTAAVEDAAAGTSPAQDSEDQDRRLPDDFVNPQTCGTGFGMFAPLMLASLGRMRRAR
jgi:hypothetical protein